LHSERLLLIGHDEGLSVLDFFPQEWSEAGGIDVKSPDEAHTKLIWEGEGYGISFLVFFSGVNMLSEYFR
jgi:hypothetical protein